MMDKGISSAGMMDERNLATLANASTRRQMLIGAASILGGLTIGSIDAWACAADEISHTCEAIHQEVVFKVGRKRVYEALTDATQFNKVVLPAQPCSPAWLRAASR
jgi:hypothetical protein